MAKIQGITVQIGGDASGLNKAIKDTEKNLKNTDKQLKEVNKSLKFDPKNTELLTQKQRLLKEQIGQVNDKLKALKSQDKDMQASMKSGKISQEQYDKFRREIINTESQLKNCQSQLKKTNEQMNSNSVDKLSGSFNKLSSKLENTAVKFAAISTAILGVSTAAVKAFEEVDNGIDTMITMTGATGQELRGLEQSFDNVFSSFPATSEEVGSAIGEINTRLGFTGDKLDEATIMFLKFSKITGIDVAQSVRLTSRAMSDAGIKSEDYVEVLDAVTKASQKSGVEASALLDTITKYGAPMRALGMDMKSSIALFSQWEKSGVNTEIALSGMKKAISNWGKANKDSQKEFAKTLEQIKKAKTLSEATTMAIKAFGAKAGPDLADAIQNGRFSIEEFQAVLAETNGTVQTTYDNLIDGNDQWQVAMNNVKIGMGELGSEILEDLAPILSTFGDIIKDLGKWFSDLDETDKNLIKTLFGAGGLIILLPSAIKLFESLSGIIEGLSAKTVLAYGGFALLIWAIKEIITNWDKMNGIQKTVAILGAIAIAAAAAAAAIGALQSAWSLGIAAAAIVAGTVAIAAAVKSAQKDAKKAAEADMPAYAKGTDYVPEDGYAYLHKGEKVIPAKQGKPYKGGDGNVINLTFNAQTLDDAQINKVVKAVNKSLGNAY